MLCLSALLLLLSAQVPAGTGQVPAAAPQETPTTMPAPTYDQGPLRAEVVAMREIRFRATDPEMAARLKSELDMQVRIQGERITQVVRQGNLIFTELVDDTGQSLLDADTYTEADRTMTRPMPPQQVERLRTDGLILTTRNKQSTRGAVKLKVMRGAIRLILAEKTEKVTIADPLEYYDKSIGDSRLKEFGIEIKIVPVDQLETPTPPNRCLLLHYVSKGDHIQKVSFVDGAMKPVPARETQVTTKSGVTCQQFYFDTAPINNELQLVLDVLPQMDDIQLPIDMENVDLP
jgi:hypothetical protein